MKNNHSKFLFVGATLVTMVACGSGIRNTSSSQGAQGNAVGTNGGTSGGANAGTGGASCGNGNSTAGNGNATTSRVPTAWVLVAGSKNIAGTVISNGNGEFYGYSSNVQECSVDGGNTWTPVNPNNSTCHVDVLTSDANVVYGNCATEGEAQTGGGITGISRDGGVNWSIIKYGFGIDVVSPEDPNTAYGHEEHKNLPLFPGSYVTHDGGATWATVTNDGNAIISAMGPSGKDLYASNYNGTTQQVVYSHDGGATWTTVAFKGDGVKVTPATSEIVYGNAVDVELDVSRDGGATWNTVYPGCLTSTAVSPWDPNFVFAMTCVKGTATPPWEFIGTADGGKTWTKVPTPTGCPMINSIDFDAQQKSVFAQCDNGLYISVPQQ